MMRFLESQEEIGDSADGGKHKGGTGNGGNRGREDGRRRSNPTRPPHPQVCDTANRQSSRAAVMP
jgi:hypothetical protein